MVFEWDENKNQANHRKHGFCFEVAAKVFGDPLATIQPDPGNHEEDRWRITGRIGAETIILVAYVIRGKDSDLFRLISARKATNHERRKYQAF